jgi:hypothetical protein
LAPNTCGLGQGKLAPRLPVIQKLLQGFDDHPGAVIDGVDADLALFDDPGIGLNRSLPVEVHRRVDDTPAAKARPLAVPTFLSIPLCAAFLPANAASFAAPPYGRIPMSLYFT